MYVFVLNAFYHQRLGSTTTARHRGSMTTMSDWLAYGFRIKWLVINYADTKIYITHTNYKAVVRDCHTCMTRGDPIRMGLVGLVRNLYRCYKRIWQ